MGKSSSSKTQITEYRMSMHVCVGMKLDAVTEIRVDEKVAWSGEVTTNTALNINRPDLFGGEKKEGGLVGTVQVMLGADTQVAPAPVAARYGRTPETCPGFRGYTSLFFHGSGAISTGRPTEWDDYWADPGSYYYGNGGFLWKTNSPVIAQRIEVTGRRAPKGLNPANAMIGPDANPIHMIYECLINDEWGMAGAVELIDTARWNAEALRLKNEAFGLSTWWMRQTEIESFVGEILDHIQATMFFNPNTGLLDITLLRGDYDLENLRVITPNNATLSNFKRRSSGEIVNEISVEWTNPENEDGESVTAQDIASIASQDGQKVSNTRNYYMVRNRELAVKLLERDLRASTAPLISADAALDRSGWDILPGEVVRMSWPRRSDFEAVMRVGRVSYGKPTDSKIRVSLLQDVYSLELPPIRILPSSEWVDSRADPAPLSMQITTIPAYFARNAEIQNTPVSLDDGEVLAMSLADSQTYDSLEYELVSESAAADGSIVITSKGALSLTPKALLAATLPTQTSSLLPVSLFPVLDEAPRVGGFVFIGYSDANQEIGLVTAQSEDGWTIARGVLDTVPRTWAAGTPLWVVNPGARIVDSQTLHSAGETVAYRGLDRTAKGMLPLADAPLVAATLTNRPHLPLRPTDVKINGTAFGSVAIGAATSVDVTWATRNRLMEDAQVMRWTEAAVLPEYRQETVIRAFDSTTGDQVAEYAWMWTDTSRSLPKTWFDRFTSVRFEILSRRDDLLSLHSHSITVTGFAGDVGAPLPPSDTVRTEPTPIWPAPATGAFTCVAGSSSGPGGSQIPALIVAGKQDDPEADALVLRYRAVLTGGVFGDWLTSSPITLLNEDVRSSVSSDVQPSITYQVAVGYLFDGVPGLWRNLPEVTTGALVAADTVAVGGRPVDDLLATVDDLVEMYGDTVAAEASAAAAAASASAAALAEGAAEAARDLSIAAQGAAEDARDLAAASHSAAASAAADALAQATAAGGSATTAAGHATTATTKASEAAGSASAAAASAVTATAGASNASFLDAYSADTFVNSTDGWSFIGITPTTAVDGLTITSASADPIMRKTGVSILGSRYTRIIAEVTRTANRTSGTWDGAALYQTAGHGETGSYYKSGAPDPVLGVRTTLTWDMSALTAGGSDWIDSTITTIRLDLDNGNGGAFKIHSVRVVGGNTAAPAQSAAASAVSASAAAASQTAAASSASASETSRLAAVAAQGGAVAAQGAAESARDASAASAATADSHRAAAQTSETNAANSATAAGTSAGAAAGSASSAASSASDAAASSTAASNAVLSARASVVQTLPSTFEANGQYFTNSPWVFDPSPITADGWSGFATVSGHGTVYYGNGVLRDVGTLGLVQLKAGRRHRVQFNGVFTAGPRPHRWVAGFHLFNAAGTLITQWWTHFTGANEGAGTWMTVGGAVSLSTEDIQAVHPTATHIRPAAICGWGDDPGGFPESNWQIDGLRYSDVTESVSAAGSASAAVSAASTATAQADLAGTRASAADASRVAAETARGGAETAQSNAASSASSAAGSASTASSASSVAASARDDAQAARDAAQGYRDTAGGHASAAVSAASTATAQADLAGTRASAADASRIAAETARGGAETAQSSAASSASDAAGSASAASSASSVAATARDQSQAARDAAQGYRDTAGGHASAAAGSASTATAQADLAGTRASAADASRVAAQTAEAGAAAYQSSAASSASSAAGSASAAAVSAGLIAQVGIGKNEWSNANLAQGTRGATAGWDGTSGGLPSFGIDYNGPNPALLYVTKGAGGQVASDNSYVNKGSMMFRAGPEKAVGGAPDGCWKAAAGERIGVALDMRTTLNGYCKGFFEVRVYNMAGSQIAGYGFERTASSDWVRIGTHFTATQDCLFYVDSYLIAQGTSDTSIPVDYQIRRMTMARMMPGATELPKYSDNSDALTTARIATEESVRASETAALASAQSTISASVGALSSTVTTQGAAIATAEGKIAATWGVNLVAGGKTTGARNANDGTTTAWDFVADYFRVRPETGDAGIEIDAANGILRIKGPTRRIVLKPEDLIMWVGPSSVANGAEEIDNGILGISETDGFFGGETLSGPFDSGEVSGSVTLTTEWQDVVTLTKRTRNGFFGFWPQASITGSGTYNSETGRYHVGIGWRVVSTDMASGDVVELSSGTQANNSLTNVTMPLNFAPAMNAGESIAFSRTGQRRLALQVRRNVGASATLTLARLRGFYSA